MEEYLDIRNEDHKLTQDQLENKQKEFIPNSNACISAFDAKDAYLSHLAKKRGFEYLAASDEKCLLNARVCGAPLLKPLSNKLHDDQQNGTTEYQLPLCAGPDLLNKIKFDDKPVTTSRVSALKNYFLQDFSKTHTKYDPEVFDTNDDSAYNKVAGSINALIDIEKDFKKCGSEYGVYKLLRNSRNLSEKVDDSSGILESNCLRPSLFKMMIQHKKDEVEKKCLNYSNSGIHVRDPVAKVPERLDVDESEKNEKDGVSESECTYKCIDDQQDEFLGTCKAMQTLSELSSESSISTSILPIYEYNKNLVSSSVECLSSYLEMGEEGVTPSNSSDSINSKMCPSHGINCEEPESQTSKRERICKSSKGDPKGDKVVLKKKGIASQLLGEKLGELHGNAWLNKKHATEAALPFAQTPLYATPEQHDFFKVEEFSTGILGHAIEPVNAGCKSHQGRRIKRNFSDTDARRLSWTEYRLGRPLPSISVQTLSTGKCFREDSGPDKLQKVKCINGLLQQHSNQIQNPACEQCDELHDCAPFSPKCCHAEAPTHNAETSTDKTDDSFCSEDCGSFSQSGNSKRSALKSMPCPSLYYHTTWLDNNCSFEVIDEASPWGRDQANMKQSIPLTISQGWINIDEDSFNKYSTQVKKSENIYYISGYEKDLKLPSESYKSHNSFDETCGNFVTVEPHFEAHMKEMVAENRHDPDQSTSSLKSDSSKFVIDSCSENTKDRMRTGAQDNVMKGSTIFKSCLDVHSTCINQPHKAIIENLPHSEIGVTSDEIWTNSMGDEHQVLYETDL